MALSSEGLRGFEFKEYFEKIPIILASYQELCSLDTIPKLLQIRKFIIVNLSKQNQEGTHWIVIVRSHNKTYEIFNSLGFENLEIIQPYFKLRSKADILFNETSFQLENSTTCGLFSIYFIIHRILNFDMSFHDLLEDIFNASKTENESQVMQFCNRLKNAQDDSSLFDLLE